MKKVDFYGFVGNEHQIIGSLRWTGTAFEVSPDTPYFRQVLEDPIFDHAAKRPIRAHEAPEAFLENLRFEYTGSYFRASEVIDEPDAPPVTPSTPEKPNGP